MPNLPGDDPPVRWIGLFTAILTLLSVPARGQVPADPHERLSIYLCTYGPGAEPWEKFGHDGIAITDNQTGESITYNWGVFSFGSGFRGLLSFGGHFLQGKLIYSMDSMPTDELLDGYRRSNRSVLFQELRLTHAQKLWLLRRLIANDTDENRYYLYDYFRKNCTTMARDALDQTVDGRISAAMKNIPTNATYRWHDRRATADTVWLYVFLDFILGHGVDRPLSAWDEAFLPGKLAQHLRSVQVPGPGGEMLPLVMKENLLMTAAQSDRTEPPNYFFWGFFGTGFGIGGILASLAVVGKKSRFARWLFSLGVMTWSLLLGLLGGLATYAWFTNHDAAKWNENWFQGNPLSLLLIVLMPLSHWWPKPARIVAFVLLGLSVFGLLAKVTPWFWQVNGQIIAAALPVHLAIAFGIWQIAKRRLTSPTTISERDANIESDLPNPARAA